MRGFITLVGGILLMSFVYAMAQVPSPEQRLASTIAGLVLQSTQQATEIDQLKAQLADLQKKCPPVNNPQKK